MIGFYSIANAITLWVHLRRCLKENGIIRCGSFQTVIRQHFSDFDRCRKRRPIQDQRRLQRHVAIYKHSSHSPVSRIWNKRQQATKSVRTRATAYRYSTNSTHQPSRSNPDTPTPTNDVESSLRLVHWSSFATQTNATDAGNTTGSCVPNQWNAS